MSENMPQEATIPVPTWKINQSIYAIAASNDELKKISIDLNRTST